nr:FAD-dependent oxidoreductase [Bacteroidota bacterium]
MARLLILGAGIAGHTAALHARHKLGSQHDITVVSPNSRYNWIPSNIWVGVGLMTEQQVTFELAPIYKKNGINFIQAKALSIHPEGNPSATVPYVVVEHTSKIRQGESEQITYDYLINATGPKLNFAATEGLGPDKNSLSVCTAGHAAQTSRELDVAVERMRKGEKQTLLIGTGHGNCTCQGAAFEYIFNVEFMLRQKGVRDKAKIIWISNEQELGDFGIGGMHLKRGGYITHSRVFTESLYAERGIEWITKAHVQKVDKGEISYETLDGQERTQRFDFGMLLPPFSGVGMTAADRDGNDITGKLFAANKFMIVDGDYTQKPYEQWTTED